MGEHLTAILQKGKDPAAQRQSLLDQVHHWSQLEPTNMSASLPLCKFNSVPIGAPSSTPGSAELHLGSQASGHVLFPHSPGFRDVPATVAQPVFVSVKPVCAMKFCFGCYLPLKGSLAVTEETVAEGDSSGLACAPAMVCPTTPLGSSPFPQQEVVMGQYSEAGSWTVQKCSLYKLASMSFFFPFFFFRPTPRC